MTATPSHDGDEGYWATSWRETRHNPCLMAPLSLIMFLVFGLFLFATLLFQVPGMLLGLLLGPILSRSSWYVEFLYPWDIGRWLHMLLIQHSGRGFKDDDKNRGFHSRCVEQKIEVVKGRVYIHPIPFLIDNLGYLIVCLPRPKTEQVIAQTANNDNDDKITVQDNSAPDPIVAIMVDCGDAPATIKAIEWIQQYHYRNHQKIQIQSICSTHKHHDHTGGNKELVATYTTIQHVYGGAVERVPYCTDFLVNGEKLLLPKFGTNDMSELVEIEAVAVPAHTRGSMVYRLSSKATSPEGAEYLFTGDTMFSGGGGVPFEADTGEETESQINKSDGNTYIRAGIGSAATERCFAEILSRAMPSVAGHDVIDKILIFPGHEYTNELLTRQLQTTMLDSCRWKNFPPRDFFETVSQMYVALHRRTLPHNSGKLLAVPSPLKREICISPHFRSMRRTGELVVRAIAFWHSYFCKNKVVALQEVLDSNGTMTKKKRKDSESDKTPSRLTKWNLDVHDINRDVFTTFYTADLETLIAGLDQGEMTKKDAIQQLREFQTKLDQPVVNRRPIPGYLPSDKNIYKGVCGLALLGSPPSGLSLSDSRTMKLPPPMDSNSDRILISRQRLTTVLERLGLFSLEEGGDDIRAMIVQLWKEAREYQQDKSDVEIDGNDEIELGILKWVLWGVPANQPSWFSKICCMPCFKIPDPQTFPDHPAGTMKKKAGDLVSHDVMKCLLCRNATGCVHAIEGDSYSQLLRPASKVTVSDDSSDDGVERILPEM
jgi:glyoxylase-like metal-dependent hydrolase (beta-lactamase superfamily II)